MDISFNPRSNAVQTPAPLPRPQEATASGAADRPALVVTETRAGALDAAEAVSESDLRRDDALGKLFSAAFALPAPPMPAFPE